MIEKGQTDPGFTKGSQLKKHLDEFKDKFDYIIIDTAPCGVVADASILSSYADGILLVVRNDMVASRRIKRAVENLENSGTKLVGCIYNDTESGMPNRFMSSYNKKYGYGYGYG